MRCKLDLLLTLALTVLTAFAAVAAPMNGNGGRRAGDCGGFKYWHEGECMECQGQEEW